MDTQIPVIPEKPLANCGFRKFQLDPLGDHLNTCTAHSGAKKTHDWMVDLGVPHGKGMYSPPYSVTNQKKG
jgi:hypothetical protein